MTGELGFPRFVVGQVLNHVERGITRVYDRHTYDREKRQALHAWGDLLDQIVCSKLNGESDRLQSVANIETSCLAEIISKSA